MAQRNAPSRWRPRPTFRLTTAEATTTRRAINLRHSVLGASGTLWATWHPVKHTSSKFVAICDEGPAFSLTGRTHSAFFQDMAAEKLYRLVGPEGEEVLSATPGALGGHRRTRVYGRLDCPVALSLIARGFDVRRHRVFFADEATAVAAGYRPCGACLRDEYRAWKASQT